MNLFENLESDVGYGGKDLRTTVRNLGTYFQIKALAKKKKLEDTAKTSNIKTTTTSQSTKNVSATSTAPNVVTVTGTPITGISGTDLQSKALSSAAKTAAADIEKWKADRPAEYTDKWASEISELNKALADRKFSYDAESDPLYRQYRNAYLENARLAMNDALGRAQAMSGGFGNSYAASAAAGKYAEGMKELSGIIPELYKAAYSRYTDEGDELLSRLSSLQKLSDSDFKKYSDILSAYLNEGKMLMNNYAKLSDNDVDSFLDYAELMQKIASGKI